MIGTCYGVYSSWQFQFKFDIYLSLHDMLSENSLLLVHKTMAEIYYQLASKIYLSLVITLHKLLCITLA